MFLSLIRILYTYFHAQNKRYSYLFNVAAFHTNINDAMGGEGVCRVRITK